MNTEDINKVLDDSKDVVNNTAKFVDEIEKAKNTDTPISAATVTSLVVSVVVVVNAVLAIVGVNKQLDQNVWYQIGTIVTLVLNLGYALWKNHNITSDARKRQAVGDLVVPKKEGKD